MYNVLSPRPDRTRWNNSFDVGFNADCLTARECSAGCWFTARSRSLRYRGQSEPAPVLDQSANDIPWLNQFKLAGSVPLPAGFVSAACSPTAGISAPAGRLADYSNDAIRGDCLGACRPGWLVNPGMTVSSMNVPLEAPSMRLSERINQLDVSVGKSLQIGRLRVRPEAAIFNALNNLAVYGVRSLNFGTSAYMVPSNVVPPRLFRLGVQVDW